VRFGIGVTAFFRITSTHAKQEKIQRVLLSLASFLATLKSTAEQLTDAQRLRAILQRAFAKFMLPERNSQLEICQI
jgi:hypothetical protein